MKKLLTLLLLAPCLAIAASTTTTELSFVTVYEGTGTADNEVVIQTGDVSGFDVFCLKSTAGVMDVYVTNEPDGGNYTSAAQSLYDFGATSNDPVTETVAGRYYCFPGPVMYVRVLQKGATAVTAATLIARRK